jgi:hypothetical protein
VNGYGRGYYGDEQLAKPPKRKGFPWVKIALVVGVGAVVWFMWPRRPSVQPWPNMDPQQPPPPNPPQPLMPAQSIGWAQAQPSQPPLPAPQMQPSPQMTLPPAPTHAPLPAHATQFAQSRGYPSTKEYEDAVVASARQLKDSGAQIVLAPHLAHLTPRLGS